MKLINIACLPAILFMLIFTTSSCKKDQLVVNEVKQYAQANFTPSNNYDSGWKLTLSPIGVAEVLPSGDIFYRGTYKINGSKISVKTQQNSGSYSFEIISDTELKEKEFGVLLKLIN